VRALKRADVTIVPYGRYRLWAPGLSRLLQLLVVYLGLRRRTVTVLHDVYTPGSRRRMEWWALALTMALSGRVVVHGERERSLLSGLPGARRALVIPHFVETRSLVLREQARDELSVDPSSRVLVMIGWIHPRKNYELALRALSLLETGVRLWLVGAVPGGDAAYLDRLLKLASELDVRERVLITGYVSEAELDLRLAAMDVGLCPYHDAAASGSLSTLLGARRPVVVSDIPLARELRRSAPRAILLTDSAQPQSLAAAIDAVLEHPPGAGAFEAILADRSPGATAQRYLRTLASVV
jgi:glycosyltransferase involved in cell wall biosynthesis